MNALLRISIGAIAGGVAALAASETITAPLAEIAPGPIRADLSNLIIQTPPELALLAVGSFAGVILLTSTPAASLKDIPRLAFLLANPALLAAYAAGPATAILFLVLTFVLSRLWRLALTRDYRDVIALGAAIAAAPIASSAVIGFYPVLGAVAGLLSPWGFRPRAFAGYLLAIGGPLAMTVIAAIYLHWLLGSASWISAGGIRLQPISVETLIVLIGAATLGGGLAHRSLASALVSAVLCGAFVAFASGGLAPIE